MNYLILTICLLAFTAYSQNKFEGRATLGGRITTSQSVGGGSNPPASPLVNQNLEGTGYDNSETWSEGLAGGTVDEDYTAIPLVGSQSLRLANAVGGFTFDSKTYTSGAERWYFFRFRMITLEGSTTSRILEVWNNVGAVQASIDLNTTGTLKVSAGTGTATTTDAMATGVSYYVWAHYAKGSGANAVADVGFSTDGVRPTGGNKFAQVTNGSTTGDTPEFALECQNNNGQSDFIFDHIYVDDVQIGDNP